MVSIDKVYQKVLAIANKEQRGYITPQEFNLLADKAQNEIYESYFGDVKTAYLKLEKTQINEADTLERLQEKLQPFILNEIVMTNHSLGRLTMPTNLYRLKSISRGERPLTAAGYIHPIEEVTKEEWLLINSSPMLAPIHASTATGYGYSDPRRSIFYRDMYPNIMIKPPPTAFTWNVDTDANGQMDAEGFEVSYYKKPTQPKWAYVVAMSKALYDAVNSVNFELHGCEEEVLVSRILQLSGLVIKDDTLVQSGAQDAVNNINAQNN
jgi:hypothetical protein